MKLKIKYAEIIPSDSISEKKTIIILIIDRKEIFSTW